jgi:hypothetical protein
MGQERIANELWLTLGLQISPRTVRKCLPKPPARYPRGDQRWSTFLKNRARTITACDFFITVTSVSPSICVRSGGALEQPTDSLQCHGASKRGADPAAATRGAGLRESIRIPRP